MVSTTVEVEADCIDAVVDAAEAADLPRPGNQVGSQYDAAGEWELSTIELDGDEVWTFEDPEDVALRELLRDVDRLRAELERLRAEVERLRPVEAAARVLAYGDDGEDGIGDDIDALRNALDGKAA
jgi:hypothetical protein